MAPASSARGISLLETLIAVVVLVSVLGSLAHLILAGVRQASSARRDLVALVLAQSLLEELLAAPWTYDATGARVSSVRLGESPPGTLAADADGFADALDADGRRLLTTGDPASAFRRRWAVSRVEASDPDTLLLQVCVAAAGGSNVRASVPDACVSAIRTRTP